MNSIHFGARLNMNADSFKNPKTGQKDEFTDPITHAIYPLFNDDLTRFVLDNTRDEVVVTANRVQFNDRKDPTKILEHFQMNIRLEGFPQYSSSMGFTQSFNPLDPAEPNPFLRSELSYGKARVLNTILMFHEDAKRLAEEARIEQAPDQ